LDVLLPIIMVGIIMGFLMHKIKLTQSKEKELIFEVFIPIFS
jgi:hypothetical protein